MDNKTNRVREWINGPDPWYQPTKRWNCLWFMTICFICLVAVAMSFQHTYTVASVAVRLVAMFILGAAIGMRRRHDECQR